MIGQGHAWKETTMFRRALFLAVMLTVPATLWAGTKAIARAAMRVEGVYLVRLNKDVVDLKKVGTRIAKAHGGKVDHFFTDINTMAVFMTEAQAQAMNRHPLVSSVEENAVGHIASMTSPQTGIDAPRVNGSPASSWGLDRIDRLPSAPPLDDSYRWAFDGTGSQIYIVDTGVLPWHPEFGGPNASRVQSRAGLANMLSGLLYEDGLSPQQCWEGVAPKFDAKAAHGTAVASIAAGETLGVAKGATIVDARAVNCDGFWTSYRILRVIEWICHNDTQRIPGRAVINMSFNGPFTQTPNESALQAAIYSAAENYNIPVVISAGNHGTNVSGIMPGNAYGSITVGGLGRNGEQTMWPASNYGDPISVYAPAEHIESATTCTPPIYNSAGVQVFQGCDVIPDHYKFRSELSTCASGGDPYFCTSGTSFAAPHVSGVIARRLQWTPGMRWADFIYEFFATAYGFIYEPVARRYVPILIYRDFRP